MKKDEYLDFLLKIIIFMSYITVILVGFYFIIDDAFDVVILALVVSLIKGLFGSFKVNIAFHGVCIVFSFALFSLLSFGEKNYHSLITFSLILFDFVVFYCFNYFSNKLFQKDIDFITLKTLKIKITSFDILYTLTTFALYIVWLFYIANPYLM